MNRAFHIQNKKAKHSYGIYENLEAGLALRGEEIKALRLGRAQISGSYVKIIAGEAYLVGANFHIQGETLSRLIKLLLHKSELKKLIGFLSQKGAVAVPLVIYEKRGLAKLLFGIGKGKKLYQKKETIKKRDLERTLQRELKEELKISRG